MQRNLSDLPRWSISLPIDFGSFADDVYQGYWMHGNFYRRFWKAHEPPHGNIVQRHENSRWGVFGAKISPSENISPSLAPKRLLV